MQASSQKRCPTSKAVDLTLSNASALMEQGQYASAADALYSLATLHCDPRVALLYAAATEAGGNMPEAEHILEHAHNLWPTNTSIAASLAREYLGDRHPDKAVGALAHFHPTTATPAQEMEMAATVYMAANRLISAQAIAEALYKEHPSLPSLLLLANVMQMEGRYPDVNRLLTSQRTAYGDASRFLITLAESEFDAGLYAGARDDLQKAIQMDAGSWQAHYILGNVLAKLSDPDRAIEEYRAAIALDPKQPRTYFQLALTLRAKRDQPGEEEALQQALTADDRYAPAHCEIGRMLLDEDRAADAVPHLQVAAQLNPNSEDAWYLLGRAYARLGEKDKSKAAVAQLLAVRKANRPKLKSDAPPGALNPDS
jgi:tetratricopeptide (TPR) repeat protein